MKFLLDTLGKWVPVAKQVAAEYTGIAARIGLVTKAAAVLSGRLTIVQAGFAALEMREMGASKAVAVLGAAGALAMSRMVSGARGAMSAIGGLGMRMGGVARELGGAVGGALGGMGRSLSSVSMVPAPVAGLALALGPVGAAAMGVALDCW